MDCLKYIFFLMIGSSHKYDIVPFQYLYHYNFDLFFAFLFIILVNLKAIFDRMIFK
jgi:hypothetical protein